MEFNLNKNNGNQSKFDLSKKENTTKYKPIVTQPKEEKKNSNKLIWLIPLGFVAIGGIWYGISASGSNSQNINETITKTETDNQLNSDELSSTYPKVEESNIDNDVTKVNTEIDNSNEIAPEINVDSINNKIPANFPKGSSSFSALDKNLVEKISSYLKSNSDTKIVVNGYASSEGPLELNQQISQKRADVFKELLISKGINSVNIEAIGKGISNPIASNETEEGRQKNRRVEVLIP